MELNEYDLLNSNFSKEHAKIELLFEIRDLIKRLVSLMEPAVLVPHFTTVNDVVPIKLETTYGTCLKKEEKPIEFKRRPGRPKVNNG